MTFNKDPHQQFKSASINTDHREGEVEGDREGGSVAKKAVVVRRGSYPAMVWRMEKEMGRGK